MDWGQIDELLPVVDLIMCDVKLMDDRKHQEWTGVGNQRILENLKRLAMRFVPMIIRTPVIPGVNQTEDEIGAVAGYIKGLHGNLLYYELLDFNPLGDMKYKGLEMENRFYGQGPAGENVMGKLAQAARARGIPVRIG